MNRIESYVRQLSSSVKAPYSLRLFILLIYLWFVIQAISLWDIRDLIWGEQSVFFRSARPSNLLNNFFFQLVYEPSRYQAVYWIHLISALISLFEFRWSFITRFAAWATGMMLYCAAPQAFNSGILVMLLMAAYSILVYSKSSSRYRNLITNFCRYAMIIQVILIYVFSSIYKLSGTQWLNGTAIHYVLNIDVFSSPFWKETSEYTLIWTITTYLVFAYQLLFPILLLFKSKRNWLLLVGVFFHLMIGVVMNLWDFGFAMIFCYALFMKEEHAKFLMPFRTLRK